MKDINLGNKIEMLSTYPAQRMHELMERVTKRLNKSKKSLFVILSLVRLLFKRKLHQHYVSFNNIIIFEEKSVQYFHVLR